jgi:hypothetical protein
VVENWPDTSELRSSEWKNPSERRVGKSIRETVGKSSVRRVGGISVRRVRKSIKEWGDRRIEKRKNPSGKEWGKHPLEE